MAAQETATAQSLELAELRPKLQAAEQELAALRATTQAEWAKLQQQVSETIQVPPGAGPRKSTVLCGQLQLQSHCTACTQY